MSGLVAAQAARGQGFAVDWFSIDGGGGSSSGGVYTVSGTIGQPDAGQMVGGEFTVEGGFWSVLGEAPPALLPNLWPLNVRFLDLAGSPVIPVDGKPFIAAVDFLYSNPLCRDYVISFNFDGTSTQSAPIDWGCGNLGTVSVCLWQTHQVPDVGIHFLRVILDAQNTIAESNESDNSLLMTYRVLPNTVDFVEVNDFLQSRIVNDGAGGCSWAVLKFGEPVVSGALGYARAPWEPVLPKDVILTVSNLVPMGSISKLLTWVALLRVWEEKGKPFSLDDPFWPYLQSVFPDVHPSVKQSTIRQLHTHTSGIWRDGWSKAEVAEILREPLFAPPPTERRYISPNTILLACMIEVFSDELYSVYVKEHVLRPLGITRMDINSTEAAPVLYYGDPEFPGLLVTGSEEWATSWPGHPSSGGWWATPQDLAMFAYGLGDARVLSLETTRAEGFSGPWSGPWSWSGKYVLGNSLTTNQVTAHVYHDSNQLTAALFVTSGKAEAYDLLTNALSLHAGKPSLQCTQAGGQLCLSFFGYAGSSFTIQQSTDLNSGDWSPAAVITGSNSVQTFITDLSGSQRFLRVKEN